MFILIGLLFGFFGGNTAAAYGTGYAMIAFIMGIATFVIWVIRPVPDTEAAFRWWVSIEFLICAILAMILL